MGWSLVDSGVHGVSKEMDMTEHTHMVIIKGAAHCSITTLCMVSCSPHAGCRLIGDALGELAG